MSDYGPVYGVELIATLPLDGGMRQAMPSRRDLQQVREISERTAAGYEVLLEHYRRLKDVTTEDEILQNKNALMREAVNIATELAGQVMRIMVGGQPIDKTILRHWLDRYFDAVRAIDSPKATSDSSPAHAHDLLCEALEALRPFAALGSHESVEDTIQYDYSTRFDIDHANIRRAMAVLAKGGVS